MGTRNRADEFDDLRDQLLGTWGFLWTSLTSKDDIKKLSVELCACKSSVDCSVLEGKTAAKKIYEEATRHCVISDVFGPVGD